MANTSYEKILEQLDEAAKRLQNITEYMRQVVAKEALEGGRPSGSFDEDPWGNPLGETQRAGIDGLLGKTPLMENKRDMQAEAREEKQEAIEQQQNEQQEVAKTAPTPFEMEPIPIG